MYNLRDICIKHEIVCHEIIRSHIHAAPLQRDHIKHTSAEDIF